MSRPRRCGLGQHGAEEHDAGGCGRGAALIGSVGCAVGGVGGRVAFGLPRSPGDEPFRESPVFEKTGASSPLFATRSAPIGRPVKPHLWWNDVWSSRHDMLQERSSVFGRILFISSVQLVP